MSKNNHPDKAIQSLLRKDGRSPVARCARHFQAAGFRVRLGGLARDSSGLITGADLLAERSVAGAMGPVQASWHIARVNGHEGLLSALNAAATEQASQQQPLLGFRPLGNARFDGLLATLEGRETGLGLIDAPRVWAEALGGILGKKGAACADYRSLRRSLDSAEAWLAPGDRSNPLRIRLAASLLVTEARIYQSTLREGAGDPVETAFLSLRHESRGPRTIDLVNVDFLETYAGMAAELVDQLPRLAAEAKDWDRPAEASAPRTMMDAWDAFRSL